MVRKLTTKQKELLNKFLKKYYSIQLYTFMILISIPLILYIINPQAYYYEVKLTGTGEYYMQDTNYSLITTQEAKEIKNKITKYSIMGSLCLIGMMISNPDSRKKITKLIKEVKKI
jgi:hypothetical protein